MNINQRGYILVFTLLMISMSVFLVTYIARRGGVFMPSTRADINRQKAQLLALSGVQLALSQLAKPHEPEENKDNALVLLNTLLPIKNRWQKLQVSHKHEGIKGALKFCIVSEQGKIPLNAIYDFKEHAFIGEGKPSGDWKKIVEQFFSDIEKKVGTSNLMSGFEKFLKERQYKVDDVTELLTAEGFDIFKDRVWYQPPASSEDDERALYLTDIFTTWSERKSIEPWLLSDSLRRMLDLEQRSYTSDDQKAVQETFKVQAQWPQDWQQSHLASLYGKDASQITTDVMAAFSTTFDPTAFSVLSYGTVGSVEQRVVAFVEREESDDENGPPFTVTIKRLYWL